MINASFKVFWTNPIEMSTEVIPEQLEFNIPLGAIIADPSVSTDLSNYYTKPQTDTQISTSVTLKADKTYVDNQDNTLATNISLKASKTYVDQQDSLLQDQINLKANASAVNQSLGTKADLVDGKIPTSQLPSFVDDVLEGTYINPNTFNDLNNQPYLPVSGKIYVDTTTNKTYRWSGSSYVEIGGGGVALGETSSTAYRGDRGKIAYDHSLSQGNPHNTTTTDISEGSKLFFTEPRVRQTVLTGLNTNTATPALATDNLLAAIGKLQAQISNSSSGSSGFNWVNADQIAGLTLTAPVQHRSLKFAKKDGMLWICGCLYVSGTTLTTTKLFNISNADYMVEQHLTNLFGAESQVAVCNANLHLVNVGNAPTNSNTLAMFYVLGTNLYLKLPVAFNSSGGWVTFNPTPIGRLLN